MFPRVKDALQPSALLVPFSFSPQQRNLLYAGDDPSQVISEEVRISSLTIVKLSVLVPASVKDLVVGAEPLLTRSAETASRGLTQAQARTFG